MRADEENVRLPSMAAATKAGESLRAAQFASADFGLWPGHDMAQSPHFAHIFRDDLGPGKSQFTGSLSW